MALTPAKSSQYTDHSAVPVTRVPSSDWGSKLRASFGKLTFTAAGTGTAQMVRMPAGNIRILTDMCRIISPVGTATSDLHVGYGAYKSRGATVAADDNAFADNLDVGGAAIDAAWSLPADGYKDFHSDEGFDIEIMYDTANSPAAGDALVIVVYQSGN